ncbi:MAG: hypothetical protein K2P84_06190, partial [Undibacterium sp.]|nr:hypothetical protein [Undibacterium sp.]
GHESHRGLSLRKTITPIAQSVAGRWTVGDLVRVTLEMHAESELGWVVIHDPIASGSSILGKGFARESVLAQAGLNSAPWPSASPTHIERANDSYRAYYQHVERGTWQTEYVLRLNNAGRFHFPPTRIAAMYAPEIYGETLNPSLEVHERK